MKDKPPVWADWLLTFWVIMVGVFYFGGYFLPALGAWTGQASILYALMLMISVGILAWNYLNREKTGK